MKICLHSEASVLGLGRVMNGRSKVLMMLQLLCTALFPLFWCIKI